MVLFIDQMWSIFCSSFCKFLCMQAVSEKTVTLPRATFSIGGIDEFFPHIFGRLEGDEHLRQETSDAEVSGSEW